MRFATKIQEAIHMEEKGKMKGMANWLRSECHSLPRRGERKLVAVARLGRCERVAGQLLFKISRKRRSECREKAIPLTKVRRIAGNRSQARQTKAECPHHMPSSTSKESFNTNNYPTVREDTYEGCRFQVSRLRDATKISRSQKQGIKQDHGVGFNSIHRSWKGGRWQVCNSLVYRVADLDPERTTRVAASLRGCG